MEQVPIHPNTMPLRPYFSLPSEIRDEIYIQLLSTVATRTESTWSRYPSTVLPMNSLTKPQLVHCLLVSRTFTLELMRVFNTHFRHRLEAYRQYYATYNNCYPTLISHNHSLIRHLDISVYSDPDPAIDRPKLKVCNSLSVNDVMCMLPGVVTLRLDLTLVWQWLAWDSYGASQYRQLLCEEVENASKSAKVALHVELDELDSEDVGDHEDVVEANLDRANELLGLIKEDLRAVVRVENDSWH